MSKTLTVLAIVLVFSLSSFAQDAEKEKELGKVNISGSAWVAYAYFDSVATEMMGLGTDSINVFVGRGTLNFCVPFEGGVEAFIQIENKHLEEGYVLLAQDNIRLFFEQAYIKVKDIGTEKMWGTFGIQDIRYEPIGAGPLGNPLTGTALLLDVTEAESPWRDVGIDANLNGAYDPPGEVVLNPINTYKDTIEPVGLKLSYQTEQFTLDTLIFPAVMEGLTTTTDETIYGFYVTAPLAGVGKGSQFFGCLTLFSGSMKEQNVYTLGLGTLLKDLGMKGFEFFVEAYAQFGKAGRIIIAGEEEDWGAKGRLIHGGFKYAMEEAWIGLSYLWTPGDGDVGDDEMEMFVSYEDNDGTLIIESNDLGFDVDHNYSKIAAEGGFLFAVGAEEKNTALILRIAMCGFDEEVNQEDDLGTEIDVLIKYNYSKNISFIFAGGYLFGADALEPLTTDAENRAYMYAVGTVVSF
jgi:hypothetical protein